MKMWVLLGGKVTVTPNISYFIKGWPERLFFNLGRIEKLVPVISS